MDTTEETNGAALQTIASDIEHLMQSVAPKPGEDADFSDDPEVIFRREYAKLDTIPLVQSVPMRVYVLFFLLFASFIGGAIIGAVTYPTVTITITPVSKTITSTTSLDVLTRSLAPVTISKSQTAATTGHGHQNAAQATGTLIFYNGSSTPQYVSVGRVFTGTDGVKVTTDQSITVPAANLPVIGSIPVLAHAMLSGSQGNIAAFDINMALSPDLKVRNEAPFSNGRDARTYQAVSRTDLDALTNALKTALVEGMPQAFTLQPGETVTPTGCHFTTTTDHGIGEEATTITVKATSTCKGIAYNTQELEMKATAAFTHQTNPGAPYELLHTTPPQVVSLTPLSVRISGTWVYILSQDYEQFLAEKIAGESQEDARASLLRTGVITRASVPAPLPKDPGHIHFVLLIEG